MEYLVALDRYTDQLLDPLRKPVDEAAVTAGLSEDQLRYIVCLVAAHVFGLIYVVLPGTAALRHALSPLVSFALFTYALGPSSFLHSVVSASVGYVLLVAVPSRRLPAVMMVWAMGYMSLSHAYRMYTDWMGWHLDFTGPQMIITIKLTSIAYNLSDGRSGRELRAHAKAMALPQVPNLLEYFGFIYFFPSFLAGPSVEFIEYRDYVAGRSFPSGDPRQPPSGRLYQYLRKWVQVALMLPFMLAGMMVFQPRFLVTAEYAALPLWERLVRLYVHSTLIRFKYYFAWFIAEGAFITCGFSYERRADGSVNWDRGLNSRPLACETGQNMQQITGNWNLGTQRWLKNYIYFRHGLNKEGRSTGMSTIYTFLVSAIWHGFYPGYYWFFLHAAFLTIVEKLIQAKIRPYFLRADGSPVPGKLFLYDIPGMAITLWHMCYYGVGFALLDIHDTITYHNHVYWIGHITLFSAWAILTVLPKPPSKSISSKKVN